MAVNVHGLPRFTEDLDIFVAPERENVEALKRALRSVFPDPSIDEISADDLLGDYPAVQYVPPEGAFYVDILTRLGEAFRFEDLETQRLPFEGLLVTVVTPRQLYLMKKDTDFRPRCFPEAQADGTEPKHAAGKAVLADPTVESMAGFIGGGRGINNAQTFVRLKPLAARGVSAQVVAERIRNGMPLVPGGRLWLNWSRTSASAGAWARSPRTTTPCWPTTPRSSRPGPSVYTAALEQLPELTGFEAELVTSQQIMLDVDRSLARQLGIGMADVTQALNNAFGQRQVSTIYNHSNQYRVVMEVAPEHAQGPEALDRLHVIANGQRIPLSAFSRYGHSAATDRVSSGSGQPAARDPLHAADRLHRAWRAVRELSAPAHDPVDAPLGGRRGLPGARAARHGVLAGRHAGPVPAGRRGDEERDPDDRRAAEDAVGLAAQDRRRATSGSQRAARRAGP